MNELDNREDLTEREERLLTQLFNIGAVKFGNFKLVLNEKDPKAPLSPVYFDLRLLRRDIYAKDAAVSVYAELLQHLNFDLIADIPTAVTPLVSSLCDRLSIGQITPRTDSKTHGTGSKVDGLLKEDIGKTVLLIDDLVTHADSKLNAISILETNGMKVRDIVVLIDREQGGREKLKEADIIYIVLSICNKC